MEVKSGKICKVCTGELPPITYKNPDFLAQFLTPRGMIKAKKSTGLCSKHHRQLARNIKRARHLALLPFTTVGVKLQPHELKEIFESSAKKKQNEDQQQKSKQKEEELKEEEKEEKEE
ncbi:MAG: 30S ribosomal protein S18 [Candidatus Calescibacterium sp.]|jgi:SSU ribosomal protein S18P